MENTKSQEDYLETIYLLKNKKGRVHAVDIAETLGYTKPSVSRAVAVLKEKHYITVDEEHLIELTEEGKKQAQKVYRRHCTLKKFLCMIGVSTQEAEQTACEIEHVINDDTCVLIESFLAGCGR